LAEALLIQSSARKIPLTRELSTLQMRDGVGLMAYVGRERTLRSELAGAGHPVGEVISVVHALADILKAYKTVTTVFLAAGVSLKWDQLFPAILPVEVEQKQTGRSDGGEASVDYSS